MLEECHPPFTRAVLLRSDLRHGRHRCQEGSAYVLSTNARGESPSEGVAVLGHRIRGVAVPADLPVPELFLVRERDGAHPLCTLVRVALRHEEAHGSPVFDRGWVPVPLGGEEDVRVVEDIEGMGRRVPVAASERREARGRPDLRTFRDLLDGDPNPLVVEGGPAGDAMEGRNHFCGGKSQELVVREADWFVDRAVHAEVPLLRVEARDDTEVEPRPFPNLPLPGREMSLRRHPSETIKIPRYKSLCRCSERIFGMRLHASSNRNASPRYREKTKRLCAPTKV